MITLSVVIPCYNEAKNIPALVARCREVLTRKDVEFVLVNNGSTDDSVRVLEEVVQETPQIRMIHVPVNQGYGFGILSGLRACEGRYIGWTHADLQTDPGDALRALEILEKNGLDDRCFIKGKRYGRPLSDLLFTMGMAAFVSLALRRPFWDVNAQPNIFPKTFFETWKAPPHDFSLDLYAYYQARSQSLLITRFAVRFGERLHGISHWNVDWKGKYKFIERTVRFTLALRRSLSVPQNTPPSLTVSK